MKGGEHMGKHNKSVHMVTFLLLVIGGLNWLLIGLFNLDVVQYLGDPIARIVYILVGLSAVYEFAMHKKTCKTCSNGGSGSQMGQSQGSGGQDQQQGL